MAIEIQPLPGAVELNGGAVLRGLMRTGLVGFAVGDSLGHIFEVNETFARLLGYSREELLATEPEWHRLTPAEYYQRDREAFEEVMRGGHSRGHAKECWHKSGVRVPVLVVGFQTAPHEYAVFMLDDSGRHAAEEDLRRTEGMYRQILDAIPDHVLLRGSDGRVEWANRALLDFHGTTQEALAGDPAPQRHPARESDPENRTIAAALASGTTVDLPPHELIRRDGTPRIFHTVKSPLTDAAGNVVRTISVSRDITDRARSEQALLRSEQNLRMAQSLAHIGSYECDLPYSGNDYWSEETFRILGLPFSRHPMSVERYIARLIHPEDRARAAAAVEAAQRDLLAFDLEYRVVRPDGSTRWIRSLVNPILDAKSRVVKLVGTIVDVTAQREAEAIREGLEASLRQAQKLEAVGTLAGGIAHDFNNILGALRGYAELALESVGEDTRAGADLELVLEAAARAADLVSRILTFSRQQEHRHARIRPERPIFESLRLLRATLPATIEIRTHFDPDTPQIAGDETQIVQVMMNLGTNAMHAMTPRGGLLQVNVEPFVVDGEFAHAHPELTEGAHVLLSVSDSGSGIEPQLLDRVLEPFFTTKAPGHGTGLGLSVVHGIVREHGGALILESTPGAGTIVRVYLPATTASDDEAPARLGLLPRGHGERVLVVDDEVALAELERRRLEDLGYVATAFTDPRRALEAFSSRPDEFDLVLTDHTMPQLTGIELAHEVRNLRPALPIVLMSGYGDAVGPELLETTGIRRLLSKPVATRTLALAVKSALEEP